MKKSKKEMKKKRESAETHSPEYLNSDLINV